MSTLTHQDKRGIKRLYKEGKKTQQELADYYGVSDSTISRVISGKVGQRRHWLLRVAIIASENSYCKRSKVGVVIAKNDRILSTGWNGTPSRADNCCEEFMFSDTGVKTNKRISKNTVIHAEANAILWAAKQGIKLEGTTLYSTLSPCIECTKMIIQSGITKVVYKDEYRDTTSLDLLKASGVVVVKGQI